MKADKSKIDTELAREMALVRQLVSMGHAARNSAELSVRQPLQSVGFGVGNAEERAFVAKYDAVIKDELNVKEIEILQETAGVTSYTLKPDFSKLGRKLRGDVKKVADILQNANETDAANWGRALLKNETITITVDDKVYDLAPDEVEVRQESAAEGYVIFEDKGYVAALNTNLTDDLVKERLANEVQRRIQVARKDADFNIEDRIEIFYQASDTLKAAIEQFSERIQRETLADSMKQGDSHNGFFTKDFSDDLPRDLKDEKLIISVKQV